MRRLRRFLTTAFLLTLLLIEIAQRQDLFREGGIYPFIKFELALETLRVIEDPLYRLETL